MNTNHLITAILLFLIAFLLGWRLRQAGTPRSTLLLTLHKLIALGAGVLLAMAVYPLVPVAKTPSRMVIAGSLAALCFLGAVVSGGLASLAKPVPVGVRLHRILPYMVILFAALTAYLFAAK